MGDYTILALTFILVAFSFLLIEKQKWLLPEKQIKGLGILIFLMFVMVGSVYMSAAQGETTGALFTMNVISNTMYQNANTVPLYIYASATGGIQSFMGSNNIQLSFVQSSGSQTLVVPPNFYYQLNYTGTYNSFAGELLNTTS